MVKNNPHYVHLYEILSYAAMLKKSKISNNFRSFKDRISKINRVTPSIISNVLKLVRFLYDHLFERYRLHRLTY